MFFLDAGLPSEVTDFPTNLGVALSSYHNLVLGLHTYTHGYTIDTFIGQKPPTATYPWGGYDQAYALGEREARAINAALLVTEFGNDMEWDPYILTNELVEQERHRVGFEFWTWRENCGGKHSWGMFEGIDCSSTTATQAKPASGCLRPGRELLLARVYPSASADADLTYHYDASSGAFDLKATGKFGDVPTVVVIPAEVTGDVSVAGAVAGEPAIAPSHGGRLVTVYPSGGAFSISVAAAKQAPAGCDTTPAAP
jgi:hypothetical protein